MTNTLLKINPTQIIIFVLLSIGIILIILSEINYVSYYKFLEYQKTLPPGHSSPFHQGLQFFYYQISVGIILFTSGVILLIKTQKKHCRKIFLFIGTIVIMFTLFIIPPTEQISYSNTIIDLNGLKSIYTIGENIEFFIPIKTTEPICIPLRVVITYENSSKTVWSNDKSFFDELSCFTGGIDMTLSYGTKENPIIINQTGSYVIHMDFPRQIIKKFSVTE